MDNYYNILEIPKTSSQQDIKKAYKKLALYWHPDKNKSINAKYKFQKISEAYATLSNPESRRKYDINSTYPVSHLNPFEIFKQFFPDDNLFNYNLNLNKNNSNSIFQTISKSIITNNGVTKQTVTINDNGNIIKKEFTNTNHLKH